eukprot:6468816-Amphidinium_carterae.1
MQLLNPIYMWSKETVHYDILEPVTSQTPPERLNRKAGFTIVMKKQLNQKEIKRTDEHVAVTRGYSGVLGPDAPQKTKLCRTGKRCFDLTLPRANVETPRKVPKKVLAFAISDRL